MDSNIPNQTPFQDPLLNRLFLSPQELMKKENGQAIIKKFYQQQVSDSDNLNFFRARNTRQIEILLYAKGSQNMKEFLNLMNVSDGNKAYLNIDMTPQRIAAQYVGTLVESMAKVKTYTCVNAIDDGSLTEKENRLFEAIFRMKDAQMIDSMQQASGLQLEPELAYVPDDELSARIHFEIEDRLPKEIRFEKMIDLVKNAIHFEDVANRKTLYDLVTLNAGFTKIEKLGEKKYSVRKCIPSNMVYNFFMNDLGEAEITMIGEFYNLKVKDVRERFGKTPERPDGLTEKQIFELARLSAHKNIGTFNYMWNEAWAQTIYYYVRPYDDSNILVMDCEINCPVDVYFTSKKDAYGKDNITQKTGIPYQQIKKNGEVVSQPKPDNVEVIKRQKNTWMRGVYAPGGNVILYWGEPDLIINPFTDISKPLSSYTAIIPNNDGDYVPSLFERIMEPLKEYTITKLKRKQLISSLRPTGIRIDVESARNIDLGNGNTIDWEEVLRIYNQTGTEVWSSRGLDPLSKETPAISPAINDPTIQKILELTNVLAGIVNEIRQLIGVPQYRDGSDVGDRTSGVLQQQQVSASYNVTDFIQVANKTLWEQTFYKLCLLHWNDIVKEEPESKEDMLNTRFQVTVETKSTDYQREILERDIDRYSQVTDAYGNPALTPKDAQMLREIDNFKLAYSYMVAAIAENRKKSMEDSERLQAQNAKVQQESAAQAAESQKEIQREKIKSEKDIEQFRSTKRKEELLLQGILQVAAKDESGMLIKQFIPAIQQLVPNITIPLKEENEKMVEEIMAEEHAEQQMVNDMAGQEQPMMNPQMQNLQPQMQ